MNAAQLELFDGETFRHPAELWPCAACGCLPVPDRDLENAPAFIRRYLGADPCLGWLPGVVGACCRHGATRVDSKAYLLLQDGRRFADDEALALMRELGGNPPDKQERRSDD